MALATSDALLDALASMIDQRQKQSQFGGPYFKHDAPTGTPDLPYYTGPGGLFTPLVIGDAVERNLISTIVQPRSLGDFIPAFGTNVMNPLFGFITSWQDVTVTEKDGVCDDAPEGGPLAYCRTTAQFGRFERQTRELELNRVGQVQNRAEDELNLRLLNGPLFSQLNSMTVPGSVQSGSFDIKNEVKMRMLELGVSFQNVLAKKIYTGNPANNTAGGGYKEFPGLDILIGTGKVDALTNTACPSLDSRIDNYNYRSVDSVAPDADLVNLITYRLRYFEDLASRTNLNPVEWVLVMRPALFYELTAIWPCSYLTYRCAPRTGSSASLNFDAADVSRMRDDMRNGMYLLVEGKRVRVLLDDLIDEDSQTENGSVPNGSFASDIYILPLSIRGGVATLYWEYYDYRTSMAALGAAPGGLAQNHFYTDGGKWLWVFKPPKNWCIQWQAKIEPRIVLRTPHLAGRIQNIVYKPLLQNRAPFSDDPYFVGGGVTATATSPSYYNEW